MGERAGHTAEREYAANRRRHLIHDVSSSRVEVQTRLPPEGTPQARIVAGTLIQQHGSQQLLAHREWFAFFRILHQLGTTRKNEPRNGEGGGQEVFGGTLKDVRIWRPLGMRSTTELAVGRPVPMLLASLGCGDFLDAQRELVLGRRLDVGRRRVEREQAHAQEHFLRGPPTRHQREHFALAPTPAGPDVNSKRPVLKRGPAEPRAAVGGECRGFEGGRLRRRRSLPVHDGSRRYELEAPLVPGSLPIVAPAADALELQKPRNRVQWLFENKGKREGTTMFRRARPQLVSFCAATAVLLRRRRSRRN